MNNMDTNEQEDTLDKMSSLVDDESLSSSSPTPVPPSSKKPVEGRPLVAPKRPHISWIRTAIGWLLDIFQTPRSTYRDCTYVFKFRFA